MTQTIDIYYALLYTIFSTFVYTSVDKN